ncbi:MAG: beta-galactosidase, partial [Chloroflexota bacterium]|nr:beta-galactosidase [Chloroflexota bacterium]
TATSSPPAWLVTAHPEILPVDADGRVKGFGGRQSWCPSSPVYRERSLRLVQAVAAHYCDHPALALWHVSNELGCHNSRCYCDVSAAAFRAWLQDRYGNIDGLNEAWGTHFWSQRYQSWDEITPPRLAPTFPNPTQQLDFARFSSDALLGQLIAERDELRGATPAVPVTTNFMVMSGTKDMDYATWSEHVDLVSNDHYLREADPEPHIELAFSAELVRGISAGKPWLQMEQSTSAVNWGHVNEPKRPGEMRRNSLAQVARGADGISFFQWRASRAGAEKFHSAMVPHRGPDSRVFREVEALGSDLRRLAEVSGSTVVHDAAILFDWPSWWASELDSHPSQAFRYRDTVEAYYRALWRAGIPVDVVPVTRDIARYRLLIVPALYMVDDALRLRIDAFADAGGAIVMSYFSGIVDQNDHVRLGGYPGAFRDLLGVVAEEFAPLRDGVTVALDDGSRGTAWSEDLQLAGAEAVTFFESGRHAGQPAVTCRRLASGGMAWYVATALEEASLQNLLADVCVAAGVQPLARTTGDVELVRRAHVGGGQSYLFAINHGAEAGTVTAQGTDLLTGSVVGPVVAVPVGGAVVVKETQ